LRRTWGNACTDAGLEIGLYEGTKHTLGTLLKSAGEDDRVIAELFGHADIRSILPYARVKNTTVRAALMRLHGNDEG
jgi:site-specific recombinase XerD